MTKLEKENERLTKALADRQAAEDKAKAEATKAEKEAAEKRGEWERLYGESETKNKTLAKQLEAERKQRETLEAHIKERTEATLKGVEDEGLRKKWKAALDAQPNAIAAQTTLDALMETLGTSSGSPSPRPGTPGRSKTTINLATLAANTAAGEKARQEAVLAQLAKQAKG